MRINDRQFDIDKLYFTSDTHFFHKNIIRYCDRPFEDKTWIGEPDTAYEGKTFVKTAVECMNKELVSKWNQTVPEDGVIFHLGDVAMTARPLELDKLLRRLNGTKYLVIGNHEKNALQKEYLRKHWEGIYDIAEITIEDPEIEDPQRIFMCHYPMIVWNGSHRGAWQLFGHVHGGLSNKGEIKHKPIQMDVGVDTNNYYPYSYQKVKEIITKQSLK
jgi:calcineurin-like phosphoesterase family protein